MNDPLMTLILILCGAGFICGGGWKLRRTFTAPSSEFAANEYVGQQSRHEGPIMRVTHALDSLGILLVGVVVFAFGLIDLLG